MAGFIALLRSGGWLTRERARLVALALIAAFAVGASFLIGTSDGLNDRFGRPLGTDFSNVYAAGSYVLDGEPTAPFDPPKQFAREQAIFGQATQFYGWHYPPYFLGLAAALAAMPYWLALLVWQGVTLVLYLLAIRAIVASPSTGAGKIKNDWLLFALAFPAVFINLGQAHNGFLTAALIGAALVQLDRRPILAGVLIGLLAYKPQFGVLIPIALLAGGRWRTIGAAVTTLAALIALSFLTLGGSVWHAFADSLTFTQTVVLEQGGTGWEKIQSIFSAVRMWGASVHTAYAVQIALGLMLAASLAWLWQSDAAFELKAAALATGSLLATPYVLDYDLVVLAVAIAYFTRHGLSYGFRNFEISLLAAAWIVPLLSRGVAGLTGVPLGLLVLLSLHFFIMRRAVWDDEVAAGTACPIAQV